MGWREQACAWYSRPARFGSSPGSGKPKCPLTIETSSRSRQRQIVREDETQSHGTPAGVSRVAEGRSCLGAAA